MVLDITSLDTELFCSECQKVQMFCVFLDSAGYKGAECAYCGWTEDYDVYDDEFTVSNSGAGWD